KNWSSIPHRVHRLAKEPRVGLDHLAAIQKRRLGGRIGCCRILASALIVKWSFQTIESISHSRNPLRLCQAFAVPYVSLSSRRRSLPISCTLRIQIPRENSDI